MSAPAIEIADLSKSFGGVRVLDRVSLEVNHGEIHGLVGRNGSGKSTLIKILSGYHAPDHGGGLRIDGRTVHLPVPLGQAHREGLSFVHQDLGLSPGLTVLENMRIGRFETRVGWRIPWRAERAAVRRALGRFGVDVSPEAKLGTVSTVDRALIAIARAVVDVEESSATSGGVLVLDEPTAYLPRDGVERLFSAVRHAAASGTGVIFVSHRLEEITQLTERVSVLRDGKLSGTVTTSEVDEPQLIELILGRRLNAFEATEHTASGDPVLSARGLSGRVAHDVAVALRPGEIVGVTGLVGMGHEELPHLLFGSVPASGGTVTIEGDEMPVATLAPRRAIRLGMAMLPADRQGASGAGSLSVAENVSLPSLERFFRGGVLHHRQETRHVAGLLERFDVRPPAPGRRLETLSGGNQQKALIAKWMQRQPRILLLDEPTQGVDVNAREEIFKVVRHAADEGAAVLWCTSDYDDLARICDRVIVFRWGRAVAELRGQALTEERIIEQCYATESKEAA